MNYYREFDLAYGRCDQVSPLIQRVICQNPGPFTFTGTGTYIVGLATPGAKVAVIDPGPVDEDHLNALLDALKGRTVSHILITHTHLDHSPLSSRLAKACGGAPVWAAPLPADGTDDIKPDEGSDDSFTPDHFLTDGEIIKGDGWTLETITTPGHASNHLAFGFKEENALFSGDHIMGWSTTIVSPPDGDMADYIDSLDKVIAREFDTIWPTHGPPITEPQSFLQGYKAHRLDRERQVIEQLLHGPARISDMVPVLYASVDTRLWPAASLSMLSHLIKLAKEGRVKAVPSAELSAEWTLL